MIIVTVTKIQTHQDKKLPMKCHLFHKIVQTTENVLSVLMFLNNLNTLFIIILPSLMQLF
jgi:carbonic anhydrase